MNEQLVAGVRERLRRVVAEFVAAQEEDGRANDEGARLDRAAERLGKGWSVSSLKTAMRRKTAKRETQLPHAGPLVQLCHIANVNAEWLFTGTGPEHRSVARLGAKLTTQQLADEFTASLLHHCASIYDCDVDDLVMDSGVVLKLATDEILQRIEEANPCKN